MIDQSGEPVVIELNGAPDLIGLEQKAGPLLRSDPVLLALGEYDLLVNEHQRELCAELLRSDRAGDKKKGSAEISS